MNIYEITDKLKKVITIYSQKYGISLSEDYYLIKIQEELGELSSAHLKLTNRARQNQATPSELQKNLEDEIADVIAMTLLFAELKGIDVHNALQKKWFQYLK